MFTVYNKKKSKMIGSKIIWRKVKRLIYIRNLLILGLKDKLGVNILKDFNKKLWIFDECLCEI